MKDLQVRREYTPDRKLVVQAIRRLLREAEPEALETLPLGVPIRGPADRAPGVEQALERE